MKKILLLLFCSIFTLVSGVFLCSCDGGKHYISFSFPTDRPGYVTATVEADDVEVQEQSGRYAVKASAKIRIKFFAGQRGVDMSGIVVKANGQERTVQTYNTNFDSMHAGGDLYYGYILYNGLKEDVKIEVSNVDSYKNKLTFTGADLEDSVSAERLKTAKIKTPDSSEFESFYDFLQKEDPSFKVDTIGQGDTGRSFQMQFDGGNPYLITTVKPFELQLTNENNETETRSLQAVNYSNGIYTFQIGDLGNNVNANIVTDFTSLECRNFALNLPKSNLTYQVVLDEERETFNFESEAKVTIKKTMDEAVMDKKVVKAYINETPLSPADVEDQEDEMIFLIPKGITPESTHGEDTYDLRVTGMSYGENKTISLDVTTNEPHPIKLVEPEFFSVDEQGALSDIVGLNDEGQVITFANKKTALAWKYEVLAGHYTTPFDIYDYDILQNGELLFNLKAVLDEEEAKDGFVTGQDLFVEKETYALRARFNSQTQKYDDFQIEFSSEEDLQFSFDNFKLSVKNVLISYDFEDERVDGVEYAIGNSYDDVINLQWEELQKGQSQEDTMTFGEVLFFKLKINENSDPKDLDDGSEFILAPTIANQNGRLDTELLRENSVNYVILKFPLSDTYFDNVEDLMLVLARDYGRQ